MNVVERAKIIATVAHAAVGQKRKYTGEDYIVHPAEVAEIVGSVDGATDEMVAAAWLHDVVEDTGVTNAELASLVGTEVAELVFWLTDVSKPEDGNRKVRKELDRQHTAQAPAAAKTIKLADLLSNTKSITEHDANFAKVFMKEKALLLDVLKDGDSTLWNRAHARVVEFQNAQVQDALRNK